MSWSWKRFFWYFTPESRLFLSKHPDRYAQLAKFSEEEKQALFRDYRESVNLHKGLGLEKQFDQYIQKHVSSLDRLSIKTTDNTDPAKPVTKSVPITLPNGKTYADQLGLHVKNAANAAAAQAEADHVKQWFDNALLIKQETKDAEQAFADEIKDLDTLIKRDPPNFDVAAIASHLSEVQTTAVAAMKAQHAAEIKIIKDELADPAKIQTIKTTLDLATPQDVQSFQDETIKTLEANQQEELKKFEDTVQAKRVELFQNSQAEVDRISFLANAYQNNKVAIDKLIEEERKKAGLPPIGAGMALGVDPSTLPKISFKGVNIKDIGTIKTMTGRDIVISKDNNNKDVFSIEFPKFGFFYYWDFNKNLESDVRNLAEALNACCEPGKTIEFNATYGADKEYAKKLARLFVEQLSESGFNPYGEPPNDNEMTRIVIKINGDEKEHIVKIEDLFKGHEAQLAICKDNFKKSGEKNKIENLENPTVESTQKLKQELATIKADRLNPPPLAPAPANIGSIPSS